MFIILSLALIFLISSSCAATENLEEIYAEMYNHMINKDISSLGQLLDESFVLVHMTGMRQSKREYLNAIAKPIK